MPKPTRPLKKKKPKALEAVVMRRIGFLGYILPIFVIRNPLPKENGVGNYLGPHVSTAPTALISTLPHLLSPLQFLWLG